MEVRTKPDLWILLVYSNGWTMLIRCPKPLREQNFDATRLLWLDKE